MNQMNSETAIQCHHLSYAFPNGILGLEDINIDLPWRSRTLLLGANGAGKSTLLKLLAGKTLAKAGRISIGGVDPFRGGIEGLTYLGTEWAGNPVVRHDIPVTLLIASVGGDFYAERRDELIEILDIDITWHMHSLSDGERRRVQLLMGLLKPWKLLLLDEVTVDLDVLVRARLLDFLRRETESRECAVFYATHIFDGLGDWPTGLAHMRIGKIVEFVDTTDRESYEQALAAVPRKTAADSPLLQLVLHWLRQDLELRGSRKDVTKVKWEDVKDKLEALYYDGGKSRVTSYFKATRGV